MKLPLWQYVGFALLCLLAVGLAASIFGQKFGLIEPRDVAEPQSETVQQPESATGSSQEVARQNSPAERPQRNAEVSAGSIATSAETAQAIRQAKQLQGDPGQSPVVDVNANANTRYLAQHIDDPDRPEVRSVMVRPSPFDREEFLEDPQSYLDRYEPGRVWQATDIANAPHVKRLGSFYRRLVQGESTRLQAKTEPGMPLTFYSGQLGQFSNQLSAITVQADSDGIAETVFTATGGTQGEIVILASSPVARGQTRFVVKVDLPAAPVDLGAQGSSANQ